MRTLRVLLILFVMGVVGLAPGLARADAPDPATVASALRTDPLYLAPDQTALDASGEARVREALRDAKSSIYLVVAEEMTAQQGSQYMTQVARTVGSTGVYGLLSANHFNAWATGAATGLKQNEAQSLALKATQDNKGDAAGGLVEFINSVDVASGKKASVGSSVLTYAFLGLLVLGGLGAFAFVRAGKRKRQRESQRQLAELKAGVDEDVTRLGEDIGGLDIKLVDADLDPAIRDDYAKALDSYDRAKAAVDRARSPEDMKNVTEALEDGRYYMVAVRARQSGQPVPERRAPCFFNPQHGPSARDVQWAPAGGQPRDVPACAADAERVEQGADPDARMVDVNGNRRPYWEAGPQWAPYAGGYYAGYGGFGMLNTILIGTAIGSMWGGGWGGGYGGYDQSAAGGDNWSDFGGDFGGGGFGDFGGGDF